MCDQFPEAAFRPYQSLQDENELEYLIAPSCFITFGIVRLNLPPVTHNASRITRG
jgi:hypothetical protein